MIIRPYEAAGHDQGVASLTKPALRHSQSLRCVTHKACVVSPTKPALRCSQSLRCVTHKACVAPPTKPALSVSHWEGCLPRGGKGVFPGAGRVSSPVQEGCLPRCGEGVSPEAGKGFPLVRRNGFLTSNSRWFSPNRRWVWLQTIGLGGITGMFFSKSHARNVKILPL